MDSQEPKSVKTYIAPLLAGAFAGLSVDVALYPLDTVKTRLQSQQGFYKAGGFSGVYKGLLTVASTSMPTSSLFFVSYEATKNIVQPLVAPKYAPLVHLLAANVGEVLACIIRVPTEVAKQRKQTGAEKQSSIRILVKAFRTEGIRKGVYRGFLSTVLRDLPFSSIQFPLWELFKKMIRERKDGHISSFESAVCGALAGAFAAGTTTPLDVAKTRIMLAEGCAVTHKLRIAPVLCDIYMQRGLGGLFAGVGPRVTTIFVGGFVFFGMYENCKTYLEKYLDR